ncbi:lysine--tRNA ligase [bacterium]|nr:lysine--tRNA ligase [bacterium]
MAYQPSNKFEQVRAEKLERLAALGIDPWGSRFDDRQPIGQVRELAPESGESHIRVRTAGRVLSKRDSGKACFFDLADKSGRVQVLAGQKQIADDWKVVELLDLWDMVGVEGIIGRTRTGEVTIFAHRIFFLTKTLAHPPEKYHGAQDVEILLRHRYIDMIQDASVIARFEQRAKILGFIRRFLAGEGFTEVETPSMQAIAGGAAARPFITHHNALDLQLYLRIAPELYLKRCLVGGMERVFEIARVFRNEGIDATHNPEFTMMELYEAYGDYNRMMEITEQIVVGAMKEVGLPMQMTYGEYQLDFTPPWRRATYDELLAEHAGCHMDQPEQILAAANARGIATAGKDIDLIVSELFEATVEDVLIGPVFVIDYPASLCPLTKRKTSNPKVAERFELFVAGMELANAYTELNDPILQEELFTKQLSGQKEEDSMAKMDLEFILALKHGMPPAGGLGIGIDRLVMLLTSSETIRDVVIFPLLRPRPLSAGINPISDDQSEPAS